MSTILLVEDDRKLGEMVSSFLSQQGFTVKWLRDGAEVLPFLKANTPDLVLLDWMLPGVSGIDLCRSIKELGSLPVLMLTARQADGDEIQGLKVGADDYIRKPFNPDVLLARVQRLLDRKSEPVAVERSEITIGSLMLKRTAKLAISAGNTLTITTGEFDLLWLLASHEGCVVSREQVFMELRGLDYDGVDRLADVQVSRLRKKLENQSVGDVLIRSVRGQGYVLSRDQGEHLE